MATTVKVDMVRSQGVARGPYAGTLYGPGKDVEVPLSVARSLGLISAEDADKAALEGEGATTDTGDDTDDTDRGGGGVAFASTAAQDAASDAGLTDSDFADWNPSSERGFTKADVDDIVADKEQSK